MRAMAPTRKNADLAGRVHERHPIERAPADQTEVAVGVADPQAEHELDEAVVHPPDHRAHHAVGASQLVALHHVDVVGRALDEQLERGRIELPIAVGVEDPLLGRRPEPGEQRAAVATVVLVRDDAQQRLA